MDTIRAIKTDAVIYLSGPMTGLPEFNYPAFNAMAATLRGRGFMVNNPAENGMAGRGWGECMRVAIKQLCDSDVIVMLDGWEYSRGAGIEISLAGDLGIPVFLVEDLAL